MRMKSNFKMDFVNRNFVYLSNRNGNQYQWKWSYRQKKIPNTYHRQKLIKTTIRFTEF